MMSPDNNQYIEYKLKQSKEAMDTVELLIENEKWNFAINRLYYAAFYAVTALLLRQDINVKSHSGAKSQFFLHFVKTEVISAEGGKTYTVLFNWRLKSDYGDFIEFTKDDVMSVLDPTKELIKQIRNIID